jgi:hypothetical protein
LLPSQEDAITALCTEEIDLLVFGSRSLKSASLLSAAQAPAVAALWAGEADRGQST